jgi:hypothetical protein
MMLLWLDQKMRNAFGGWNYTPSPRWGTPPLQGESL